MWIASTPLHKIICVQAQPHKLIIFTISAMIKIILDNYGVFFFSKLVTHNVKSSRHYVLSVDMAILFLFQVEMAVFLKVLRFFLIIIIIV